MNIYSYTILCNINKGDETIMKHQNGYGSIVCLDKTGVSLMHEAGIPIETIRIIVGHSGKGVTETTYLYKTPKELVEAVNQIKIV